jgi:membrane associated rhomboid family serine protease
VALTEAWLTADTRAGAGYRLRTPALDLEIRSAATGGIRLRNRRRHAAPGGTPLDPAPPVFAALLPVLVLAGVALYLMTADERVRTGRAALTLLERAVRAVTRGLTADEPLLDALRARTRWPLVTPAIVVINVVVFLLMVVTTGAPGDPQPLIDWGGNFAPSTTNGEWWRLVTAMFVHAGVLHLLATIIGVLPLGLLLERAVGSVAFATIYLTAGALASVVHLRSAPAISVGVGASGALCGVYGLLLASLVWALVARPTGPLPLAAAKQVCVAAVIFFVHALVSDALGPAAELAGFIAGFTGGLAVARGLTRERPPTARALLLAVAAVLVAGLSVLPVRGLSDIRPDIHLVVTTEEQAAGTYSEAVARFRKGRITAEALARLIDERILPELQAARARVQALQGVPREHVSVVDAAREYLDLREEAWRRREAGLLAASMRALREADDTERAALEAFRRMSLLLQ